MSIICVIIPKLFFFLASTFLKCFPSSEIVSPSFSGSEGISWEKERLAATSLWRPGYLQHQTYWGWNKGHEQIQEDCGFKNKNNCLGISNRTANGRLQVKVPLPGNENEGLFNNWEIIY